MTSMCQRVCICLTSAGSVYTQYSQNVKPRFARTTGVVLKQFGSKSVSDGNIPDIYELNQVQPRLINVPSTPHLTNV